MNGCNFFMESRVYWKNVLRVRKNQAFSNSDRFLSERSFLARDLGPNQFGITEKMHGCGLWLLWPSPSPAPRVQRTWARQSCWRVDSGSTARAESPHYKSRWAEVSWIRRLFKMGGNALAVDNKVGAR